MPWPRPGSPSASTRILRTRTASGAPWARWARCPRSPWLLEVSPDGFARHGAGIPARRIAAATLARGAYALGLAAIGFSAPPTAADLLALFRVIAYGLPFEGQRIAEALSQGGATNVIAAEHGTLVGGPQEQDRDSGNRPTVLPAGVPSSSLGHGAPAIEGAEFLIEHRLQEYLQRFAESDPADLWGRAELARSCVDSFSALPREQQEGFVAELLRRHQEAPARALLDQFTDSELGDLAAPEESPLLLEYLRIASEQESRPRPLLSRMGGRAAAPETRLRQIRPGLVPRSSGAAARGRLTALKPSRAQHHRAGIESLRSLLALADEGDGARLLRVWASRVTGALSAGDLPGALSWLEAALGTPLKPDQAAAARAELAGVLAGGLLDFLVTAAAGGAEDRSELMGMLAPYAADAMIERLAVEPDRTRRRALVDLLGMMARDDPAPALRRLNDRRWYLVRNLAIVLSRSRRREAVEPLRLLSRHADHRVRREALRALRALSPVEGEGAAVAALDDPDATVRIRRSPCSPRPVIPRSTACSSSGSPAGRPPRKPQASSRRSPEEAPGRREPPWKRWPAAGCCSLRRNGRPVKQRAGPCGKGAR